MTATMTTGRPFERDGRADQPPKEAFGGRYMSGSNRSVSLLQCEGSGRRRRLPIACATVLAAVALGTATAVVPAQRANASPTDNSRSSGADTFTVTGVCSDPVRVDATWDFVTHTYYDRSGMAVRLAFTGTTRITYTDLANGNSYLPNSSGPATVDLSGGSSWVRGSNGAVFNDAGVLVSTDGRIIYDSSGAIISITGHQTPVCQMLRANPAAI